MDLKNMTKEELIKLKDQIYTLYRYCHLDGGVDDHDSYSEFRLLSMRDNEEDKYKKFMEKFYQSFIYSIKTLGDKKVNFDELRMNLSVAIFVNNADFNKQEKIQLSDIKENPRVLDDTIWVYFSSFSVFHDGVKSEKSVVNGVSDSSFVLSFADFKNIFDELSKNYAIEYVPETFEELKEAILSGSGKKIEIPLKFNKTYIDSYSNGVVSK